MTTLTAAKREIEKLERDRAQELDQHFARFFAHLPDDDLRLIANGDTSQRGIWLTDLGNILEQGRISPGEVIDRYLGENDDHIV